MDYSSRSRGERLENAIHQADGHDILALSISIYSTQLQYPCGVRFVRLVPLSLLTQNCKLWEHPPVTRGSALDSGLTAD